MDIPIKQYWRLLVNYLRPQWPRVVLLALLLLAMAGNLGLIVAGDIPTFFAGFALMGLTSVGLVLHRGDAEAREAIAAYPHHRYYDGLSLLYYLEAADSGNRLYERRAAFDTSSLRAGICAGAPCPGPFPHASIRTASSNVTDAASAASAIPLTA